MNYSQLLVMFFLVAQVNHSLAMRLDKRVNRAGEYANVLKEEIKRLEKEENDLSESTWHLNNAIYGSPEYQELLKRNSKINDLTGCVCRSEGLLAELQKKGLSAFEKELDNRIYTSINGTLVSKNIKQLPNSVDELFLDRVVKPLSYVKLRYHNNKQQFPFK